MRGVGYIFLVLLLVFTIAFVYLGFLNGMIEAVVFNHTYPIVQKNPNPYFNTTHVDDLMVKYHKVRNILIYMLFAVAFIGGIAEAYFSRARQYGR